MQSGNLHSLCFPSLFDRSFRRRGGATAIRFLLSDLQPEIRLGRGRPSLNHIGGRAERPSSRAAVIGREIAGGSRGDN